MTERDQHHAGLQAFLDRATSEVSPLATARELIEWMAASFVEHQLYFGHGTDNPHDEALVLALNALGLDFDVPEARLDEPLARAQIDAVLRLAGRRAVERVPAAYLTGEAWFAGLKFAVDRRALIPRSPLAEWIERGFEPWLDPDHVHRVLDLGTGSGCIAIACALAFPNAEITGTDVSEDALDLARQNLAMHALVDRVNLVKSDLWERVNDTFDLIVSNPPYLDANELSNLPAEYRHEPQQGLAAGVDGLDYLRPIILGAAAHLKTDGVLVAEAGSSRDALVREFVLPFVWLELARGGENVFLIEACQLPAT